ncbi:MAG TPA: acetyl-CoA carboxylase biotin carboxylase subunit [Steroidobacteraceae bacterium]|nr:acetyl-CoA carboxylase biotin carboxylase subunit [Steroidobacteraceae bacterium]
MRNRSPFRKILVANRGEIALRIMRTARALGYRTVAVYSSADAVSRHAQQADEAVAIGDAQPSQSYLNISRIIAAARVSGADAVHPGYGFLAENADFAAACQDAGLVFIGPSAQAIRAMGLKAEAKRLMLAAGVRCIPGYDGAAQDEQTLLKEATRIGFPVMIKASAGGGGRGIRLVESAGAFAAALRSARSEAQGAFGDATVILERAIVGPRHIEVQVFADRFGNVIHLGERDCSVQRRHQKLIEETPSPAVAPELRVRMGASAVAAAKAIAYEGAGTVEYLLDGCGDFYFMEMNTRLQVEHPVTEMTTGLDLVELQLRIAAGEPLPLSQEQVRFSGHSIEVRLCAEDAAQSFMPQSGTLQLWAPPDTLRVEHALDSGSVIPPHYDSMIAKLISFGADRDEARRKLIAGLEDLVALGVTTNQRFLIDCLEHPVFAGGSATTAFIDESLTELLADKRHSRSNVAALAAVLAYDPTPGTGNGLLPRWPVRRLIDVDGAVEQVEVLPQDNSAFEVNVGTRRMTLTILGRVGARIRFSCDGLDESAVGCRVEAALLIHYRGRAHRTKDCTLSISSNTETAHDGKIKASMNGRVVAVHAAVGDVLAVGQPIFTIEAMKMEHTHTAPVAGRLASLAAQLDQQVTAMRVVAEITPDPPEAVTNVALEPREPV